MTTYTTDDQYPEGGNFKPGDICECTNAEYPIKNWIYTGREWVPNAVIATTNPVTGGISFKIPGAPDIQVTQNYTWAQMQALVGVIDGTLAICSDLNYAQFVYKNGYWTCPNPIQLQPSGGIPFIVPSSGTIGNNGALSGITALPQAYPACYMYFPANAVYAGSASAWFYTVMSSTTAGTIYNNQIAATYATVTGSTLIPTTPVAFATTGPGAYTQAFNDLPMVTWTVPAGLLGLSGCLDIIYQITCTNNANIKKSTLYFDGGDQIVNNTLISAAGGNFAFRITNQGSQAKQALQCNNYGGYSAAAGGVAHSASNFAIAQNVSLNGTLNTPATDYLILETYRAVVTTGL